MRKSIIWLAIWLVSAPLTYAFDAVKGEFKDSYLVFSTDDGSYQFKFDGRIMLDFGTLSSDENPNLTSDTDFRRLRFAIKTILHDDWAAEFDVDFEGNEVDTKDMWLSYIGVDNWDFKIGHHKPNFSLAEVTTSRWYTFIEVPTPVEMFAPGRRIGFSTNHWNSGYFVGGSIFGDEADVNASDFVDDDDGVAERYGHSLRIALRPLNFDSTDGKNVLHLGFNYMTDKPQSEEENKYRYRSRLESKVADYRFLNTGKMKDVDDVKVTGIELLYLKDNWFIQSEIMDTEVNFNDGSPSFNGSGYYFQTSYFFKGSGRSYGFHDAELGAVKPAKGMSEWELAFRYSSSDLDDVAADIFGGKADITTLGLNWYANTNILFRFNYIMADLNENADGDGDFNGNDNIDMLLARIQIMF